MVTVTVSVDSVESPGKDLGDRLRPLVFGHENWRLSPQKFYDDADHSRVRSIGDCYSDFWCRRLAHSAQYDRGFHQSLLFSIRLRTLRVAIRQDHYGPSLNWWRTECQNDGPVWIRTETRGRRLAVVELVIVAGRARMSGLAWGIQRDERSEQ